MRIIAISKPKVTDDDAYIIKRLLDRGVAYVHLRKPDSDKDECRRLLESLDDECRRRIIIHNYPELYSEFSLMGIHINSRVLHLPEGYDGFKTCSCHSLEEVVRYRNDYDYLFLSPIFDSISKAGYCSRFSERELLQAANDGVINDMVVALGGVTYDRIDYLRTLGFGGVAMCGAIYSVEASERFRYLY